MKQVSIKNTFVYPFENRTQLIEFIKDKKKILIAINTEKIMNENKNLQEIIKNNIGYPDGVGTVMALRQKGYKSTKIPGAELWLDLIEHFPNKTFYLIGSEQHVIEKTVEKLKKDFPNIKIAGYKNGYLSEKTKKQLEKDLLSKRPDIVFVAQGTPRQEFLMNTLIQKYPALYMGLGGSFDVYTGNKKRAPILFRKLNLEWLYRLLKEPKRAGRQLALIKFLIIYFSKKL